jgi:hypothetical protein
MGDNLLRRLFYLRYTRTLRNWGSERDKMLGMPRERISMAKKIRRITDRSRKGWKKSQRRFLQDLPEEWIGSLPSAFTPGPVLHFLVRSQLTGFLNFPLSTRISLSLGLLSLALFIYGNILLFTSLNTCRRSAPLLWWAVMVVIGVGWFLLLEVVLVVLVVGVVGPGILVSSSTFMSFLAIVTGVAHYWPSCGSFVGLVEEVWAGSTSA